MEAIDFYTNNPMENEILPEWWAPDEPKHNYRAAVASGDCNAVRAVLDSGAPVDAPVFGHGATVLIWAVSHGEEMVRLLLERGAPVNSQDWEGITPLHNAVLAGDIGVVRLLLEHGARTTYDRPFGGPQPLELAIGEGHHEIARILKRAEDQLRE